MRKLNILFVTRNIPFPPVAGSSQRTASLIAGLSAIGDVSLLMIGPAHRRNLLESAGYRVAATVEPAAYSIGLGRALKYLAPRHAEAIWRTLSGVKFDYSPDPALSAALAEVLERESYDLVVGRYLIPSARSGILEPGMPPTIVDIDDVDSKSVAAKIRSPASGAVLRAVLRTRLGRVRRHEGSLHGRAARLWFSNPDDLALAPGKADLVPNIPFGTPERNALAHSAPDSRTILWVGSFDHRVNLEGVELFLRQAWAAILKANPDARFSIVGSSLGEKTRRRWSAIPGVEVVGFAPSLAEHYAKAALTIVPLLDGAGTKIKVLESLGYLRTCVATRHAVAGFETLLRDGDSVRVVNTLAELAGPVTELLGNPSLRHALETRGRDVVEKHFTPSAVGEAVRNSVNRLIEAGGRV